MARDYPFDAVMALAFLVRVGAGERTAALVDTPGMPGQRAYAHWRRTEPGFAGEVARLRAVKTAGRFRRGHPRWKAWDEAVADRVLVAVMRGAVLRRLLASDASLPCLAVLARWRRQEPGWDAALRMAMRRGRLARETAASRARLTPALAEEIGDRIIDGGSLRSVGAQADMPCAATLYGWVRRWPDFAADMAVCADLREDWLNDRIVEMAMAGGVAGFAAGRAEAAPLQLQVNRLAKRPGWKRGGG